MTRRAKIARTTRKLRRAVEERHKLTAAGGPLPKPTENEKARGAHIPKWLKQYHAHYAKGGGVEALVAGHLQNPAPMLDHGRDRVMRNAARMGGLEEETSDGQM